MKKIYTLLGTVFLICCFFNVAFSQTPASATWSLVNPDNGGQGDVVTLTGQLESAAMTLSKLAPFAYSGPENSTRFREADNAFPASQTDTIAGTFVQFAVTPGAARTFNVNQITYDIVAMGTGNMKTKVFYSTNPSFKTATLLEGGSGLENDLVRRDTEGGFMSIDKTVSATVNGGQTFYLRFYPWVNAASSIQTGKYIALRNVKVAGTTSGATSLSADKSNGLFSLGQNYPNPFNASTTIEVEVKKLSHVKLEVFDITGRKVANLTDEVKQPGVYAVTLNNTFQNGVYFYKLSSDGYSATRRMVINR